MGDKMKCPKCGFVGELVNGTCPNCKALISISVGFNNPNLNNQGNDYNQNINLEDTSGEDKSEMYSNEPEVVSTSEVDTVVTQNNALINNSNTDNNIDTNLNGEVIKEESKKKDLSKVYYIILAIVFVIFVILMCIILIPYFSKNKVLEPTSQLVTEETTPNVTIVSKNAGVPTGITFPTNYGNITFGGLKDEKHNITTNADVQVLRHLSEGEINNILTNRNEILNPGFKWDGVEYKVTLNDFDYLGDGTINPVMKTSLFDEYYKNNFFVVNENYYTVSPIYGSASEIKNGESANVSVVYQVPVDQNYYVCFGEDFLNLGCFINS